MTILRVPLAACVVRSGRTEFEGVALTGVGAEVVGPADEPNRQVHLWEYRDGRRVGAWNEPTYLGDQSFLLAEYTLLCEDESGARILGRPPVGAVVGMSKSQVFRMNAIFDGAEVNYPGTRWYDDGSLAGITRSLVFEHDDGFAISTIEIIGWPAGAAFRLSDKAPTEVLVGFRSGTPDRNPDREPFDTNNFTSYQSDHPKYEFVNSYARKDEQGRLDRFGIHGFGYEAMLKRTQGFSPLVWFPDATYIKDNGFAATLHWDCDAQGHDSALGAVGGIDALRPVEVLELRTGKLGMEQVAQLLELPALKRIEFLDTFNPEWIARITQEAANRRPDLYVTTAETADHPIGTQRSSRGES